MKNAIRIVLAMAVIIAMCVILIAVISNRPESDSEPTVTEPVPQKVPIDDRSSWPMFRGQRGLLGRASGTLPDSLTIVWKFKTNDSIKSSPVIVDGIVFIGSSDENIYAIDLLSGKQVWTYKTTDAIEATPCVVEGSVFVGSLDGFLYALDAKDGSLKWKYETEGQILGAANSTALIRKPARSPGLTNRITI